MTHLPQMITDLALILAAAAVSTLIFSALRQPVVLGYLIAGFIVGPHFTLWPTVVDGEGVKLWAEIGVIFLLFGLGLEFSFKKLAKVGKSALIAALFEIITMSSVGYLFGQALGWPVMDSIYLGAILSMSSTTIIIRAFDEAGLKRKVFASLVFGILIVEDLMAILLMVILSSISVPGSFSGSNLTYLSIRLCFFLIAWFLVGIYVVPSLLRKVRKFLSNEIMLIVSIGMCLSMVVLATKADFSAALGAFIMGSILAETEEGERIERLLTSVKDLFAAIFFVSVGMMIDPSILREHALTVILITVITVIGKLLGSGFGAVLSGRSLQHSTQAGMSLAQIGEFSFIIATLGVSLKVVSDFLYPIVIAVSVVTTFTTPYMIRYSGPIYSWIEARLPKNLLNLLAQYERAMSADGKEGALGLLWRSYGIRILLNSVVVLGICLAVSHFAFPFLLNALGDSLAVRLLTCAVTLAICSPFLIGLIMAQPKKLSVVETAAILRLSRLQIGIMLLRFLIGLVLVEFLINQFLAHRLPLVTFLLAPMLIFFFRKRIGRLYSEVESRFLKNLNAKERAEVELLASTPQIVPWEATVSRTVISSDSQIAGSTLEESQLKTITGATIVMIDRGKRRIFSPVKDENLLPNDEVFLIGTDEQIEAAQDLLAPQVSDLRSTHNGSYHLESMVIDGNSILSGKSIQELNLKEQFGGLIVGVEHRGARTLNPDSHTVLDAGDIIWVFGNPDKLRPLKAVSQGKALAGR
ncbi:MAG: cation:proton antiporter [Bdellovibrionaceae bacterium]|nr:cation:proton antiporter [Pseudobdellovibrionaceae bacterium]